MKCRNCGKKFKGRYCPTCGFDNGENSKQSRLNFFKDRIQEQPGNRKWFQSKKVRIALIVLVLLMVVGLAGGGDSDTSTTDRATTTEEVSEVDNTTVTDDTSHGQVVSIRAKYSGSKEAGNTLSNSATIQVYAKYEDGEEEQVENWSIETPKKLKAGKTTKVTIEYEGVETTLKVKCTTLTKKQYKKKCKRIKYKKLMRNPNKYMNKYVKYTGKVNQVIESGQIKMAVTKDRYGFYDDDILVIYEEKTKILEDDIVTIYGQAGGNYTYTTVLGANKEVPVVYAKYYKIK